MTAVDTAPVVDVRTDPTGPGEPGDRGTTVIAPAVFEKLARQAAAEVSGVEGDVRTGLDRLLPWATGSAAEASVDVGDDELVFELTFNVAYPESVRRVADEVRHHVRKRVTSLTGRTVRAINITVPELVTPTRRPSRGR